jgi:hypothetical protein
VWGDPFVRSEGIMDGNVEKHGEQGRLSNSRMRKLSISKAEAVGLQGDEAQKKLAEMGYEQELKRSLTMISILGLSFAIIAVPFVHILSGYSGG